MEELYKKDPNEQNDGGGVVSHSEPDILEKEVKWALGSTAINKASGCNGIPVELFKTLKDEAIKVLHSLRQQIWKTQQWPQDQKRSVLIPVPKQGSGRDCAEHGITALIAHAKEAVLKILHAGPQHYANQELADVQAGLRKGRGTRDQIANIHWIIEKASEFQKTSISALLTMPKPLSVWIMTNCENLLERWEYQITLPASREICMQEKKQQLEPDRKQQTESKLGKEYVKAVYCHPAYLTYMQSTS